MRSRTSKQLRNVLSSGLVSFLMTAAPALAASTLGIAEHTLFTWDTTNLELFRRFLENPGAVKKLIFRQESLLLAEDSGSSPPLYSGSFQGMDYVLKVKAENVGTNLVTEMTVGFAKQEHWYRAGDVIACFSEKYNKSQTNRVLQIARASAALAP